LLNIKLVRASGFPLVLFGCLNTFGGSTSYT
jgi:hypothetical protein